MKNAESERSGHFAFLILHFAFFILSVSDVLAAGLIPVGTQPHGGLSGKIVYTHGGHGITAANESDGAWTFQRGPGNGMIEDLGNVDQMALLVDYLFRAGATVVPLRPVGYQTNEVVLDNDDPAVTFVGDWSDVTDASVYFGKADHVPCRKVKTSKTETAHARYTPKIPETGFYPVYGWTSSGGDRAPDQLYRVHHAGGNTEVTINHRRVGNGLVYLGTYYFEAGTNGYVDISNRSSGAESVVVADMVRFGNGMGDISRGKAGVSKWGRQDESGLYWVMWHADRATGVAENDYRTTNIDRQAAISFSPRYAAYMNREADGRLPDRVFVSFHSNAGGGGKARGTLGLFNGNNDPTTATPNQQLLAKSLAAEVNDDMVAQKGQFEHDWYDRHDGVTLDRTDIEFGEINNHYVNNEFDATIVEVAFHDNQEDAELMRDPKARDAIARATYHGLVKYFRAVDGNKTPATMLPPPVTGVHAESHGKSGATISWAGPKLSSYAGGTATGFRVYASTNGYGFDGGTSVAGNDATSLTLTGLDAKTVYYFKVAAVNDGGESQPSEVVAATADREQKRLLIVNGFDRLDRALDPKQTYRGKSVDRVRPREGNSRDYVIQVAGAIQSAKPGMLIDSASNESVIEGAVKLPDYNTVVWILGEESTADHTFAAIEQKLVEQFVAGGGNLFVSGSNIAWDLDANGGGRDFCRKTLCTKYVNDNAGTTYITGASTVFDGLSFGFDDREHFPDAEPSYDVRSPDVITPEVGAMTAADYANNAGAAAVQVPPHDHRGGVIVMGFPFETITTAKNRAALMKNVLEFFEH